MEKKALFTVDGVTIWHFDGASTFFFKSTLKIDADGAPNAYGPDGKGLDYLGNARDDDGNWCGVAVKPDGTPVPQGPNDPAPGYYVSTTSLKDPDPNLKPDNPRKYVDATAIAYIVLPGPGKKQHHEKRFPPNLHLGDFAVVIDGVTGRSAYAIYADVGPSAQIGEGSIALARMLGVGSDPKRGNNCRDMIYVVFPGSGNGSPRSQREIDTVGRSHFQSWGSLRRLAECFPECHGLQRFLSIPAA